MAPADNMDVMRQVENLSDAKRKLLEQYSLGALGRSDKQSQTIRRRPAGEFAPLSLAQEQLWYRSQVEGIPPLYNESITIQLGAPLDVAALERSLAEIIHRHEIWRTSYDRLDGALVQIIHAHPNFALPELDLRSLPEQEREKEALRIVTEEARRPFDLRRGPLLRAVLLRTSETAYRLSLTAHLSIVDGVSVYQVLPSELSALYTAFSAGKPSPLPELAIQYSDYAYWQRDWVKRDAWSKQLEYWREQFRGGVPALEWPAACRSSEVPTYHGAIRQFALSKPVTDAAKEWSRSEGVTLFTTLVTTLAGVLHCYTRQPDFTIGTPSPAGRKRSEVRPLLGYFLNPVALRMDLGGKPSFRELLSRAKRVIAMAISNDDVPIEVLGQELHLQPNPSAPFFSVAVSLQPQTPDLTTGWQVTSMDADSGGAPWDLYLAFIDRADGMIGRAQYNPDLFEPETITLLIDHVELVLEAAVADPEQAVSGLFATLPGPAEWNRKELSSLSSLPMKR